MGWNGSKGGGATRTKSAVGRSARKSNALRGTFAGLAIVILAGAMIIVHFCGEHDKGSRPVAVAERAARPIPDGKTHMPSTAPSPSQSAQYKYDEPDAAKPAAKEVAAPTMQPAPLTEMIEDGLILSEVPTNMPSHMRNPYKSQVESLLSMLGKPGTPYTPLPLDPNMDLEGDFIKAMENTITVWEDESEQSEEHKRTVHWMKKAVAEARREGWKVADLLKALEQERKDQWEMVSQAQTVLGEAEETMPEHTTAVREILNAELDQAGIDPLPKTEIEDEVPQEQLKASEESINEET